MFKDSDFFNAWLYVNGSNLSTMDGLHALNTQHEILFRSGVVWRLIHGAFPGRKCFLEGLAFPLRNTLMKQQPVPNASCVIAVFMTL